jgi:hypothetical protein
LIKLAAYYFTINGVQVTQPATVTYNRYDLDSEESFRGLDGTMQRDRITTKVKLDCQWNALTSSQMSQLLKAMDDVFFNINYFDPYLGSYTSKTFYVGDRSAPVYSVANGKVIFKSFTANFIEK